MKWVLYGLIGLISFVAALAGALAVTGNLTPESFAKLLGTAEEAPPAVEEPTYPEEDGTSALARALKEREAALNKRASDLDARIKSLDTREAELRKLEKAIETRIEELNLLLSGSDTERQARQQIIAKTLEGMDSRKAAERVAGLDPEEAAAILRLVGEKDRAKIMEDMQTDDAIRLLRLLGEAPL
jgi:flagellar motility protein MotE (MotC chaperone)